MASIVSKVVDLFGRVIIDPLLIDETGNKSADFVVTVRAIALSGAFAISFPPVLDAAAIVIALKPNELTGIFLCMAGYLTLAVTNFSLYLIARFVTKSPSEVICDLLIVGAMAAVALWDIGSPTFLPFGFGSLFIAAMLGWCSTPRAIPLLAGVVLLMGPQAWNHMVFRNNLHDRLHFFEEATTKLSAQLNTTIPEFQTNYPFRLFVNDYYSPRPWIDLMSAGSYAACVIVLFFGMYYQTAELRKQKDEANAAVRTVISIATALRKYDTASAKAALSAGQRPHLAPEEPVSPKHSSPAARSAASSVVGRTSAAERHSHGELTSSQQRAKEGKVHVPAGLSKELAEPLEALVANLDAYRPYLPNWLLEQSTGDDSSGQEDERPPLASDDDEVSDSSRNKYTVREGSPDGTAGADGRREQRRRTTKVKTFSRNSSITGRSDLSTSPSSDRSGTHTNSDLSSSLDHAAHRTSKHLVAPSASKPTVARRTCSFAVVTFDAADGDKVPQHESLSEFVDAVHVTAAETKGAVHSFVLGEVLLSWNCATQCANPESKVSAFVARLGAKTAEVTGPLRNLRCSAAAVTGTARCETAGNGQRAVTSLAPAAAIRLRGLSAFARAAAAESPTLFSGICDEATSVGAAAHFIIGPAGVVDLSRAAPVPASVALVLPTPGLVHSLSGDSGVTSPKLCESFRPESSTRSGISGGTKVRKLEVPLISAAFEIVEARAEHGEEWLYAMTDGPTEIACKALARAAAAMQDGMQEPRPVGSPTSQVPDCAVCRQHSVVCSNGLSIGARQALTAAAAALDRAGAMAHGDGVAARPLWRAWRGRLNEFCTPMPDTPLPLYQP